MACRAAKHPAAPSSATTFTAPATRPWWSPGAGHTGLSSPAPTQNLRQQRAGRRFLHRNQALHGGRLAPAHLRRTGADVGRDAEWDEVVGRRQPQPSHPQAPRQPRQRVMYRAGELRRRRSAGHQEDGVRPYHRRGVGRDDVDQDEKPEPVPLGGAVRGGVYLQVQLPGRRQRRLGDRHPHKTLVETGSSDPSARYRPGL